MDDTTPINARPQGRLSEAVEDAGLAVREHVVWPVEDRAFSFGIPGGAIAAAAAVVLAVGIGVAGLALTASGGSGAAPAGEVAKAVAPIAPRTAHVKAAAKTQPAPTLHGAAPVFQPAGKGSDAKLASKPIESAPGPDKAAAANTGSAATDTISSTASAQAASADKQDPEAAGPPAGPEAIAVAHEFADAFVVYETGGERSAFRKGFKETASAELSKALLHRPPRQPAGVQVPQAKVLNVVAAPSHGSVYPVSVSLLRVGVTSELRLEMEQTKRKRWRVTNVLG